MNNFKLVAEYQKEIYKNDSSDNPRHDFVLPLTCEFLGQFGENAVQLSSGESFVVQAEGSVFKFPFFPLQIRKLNRLLFKQVDNLQSMKRCTLPIKSMPPNCKLSYQTWMIHHHQYQYHLRAVWID
jgi:hypothetical protein